jgi:hypothetical protein
MSEPSLDSSSAGCLERTRLAVLNVLVVVGLGIAASGFLLRWRDRWAVLRGPEPLRKGLLGTLVAVVVLSYVLRRRLGGREALRDPARRFERLYRSHVLSAGVAALAVPLGLVYGWYIRPRIDAVVPFWIAALALGFLALPRAIELEGFDEPAPRAAPIPGASEPRP